MSNKEASKTTSPIISRDAENLRENKAQLKNQIERKDSETTDKVINLVKQAKESNNQENLKTLLKEIKETANPEIYESQKNEIAELEEKLINQDASEYNKMVAESVDKKLAQKGIEIDNLEDGEEKTLLVNLKNGELNGKSKQEIKDAEKQVNNWLNTELARKKLEELMNETGKVLTSSVKYTNQAIEQLYNQLLEFSVTTDIFEQAEYQTKKPQAESLLLEMTSRLQQEQSQNTTSPESFP